jgi:subtilase-type serine protease
MRVRASLSAAVAMVGLTAGAAQAQLSTPPGPIKTYDGDPGKLGDPASWRTPEFLRDNGMLSVGAEFAYAAGYAGQGENIGMVDSGVFADHIREHGSYDNNYTVGDRFISIVAQGGNTGPTGGFVDPAYNDIHGTHVSGTIAASRDGRGEPTRPVTENMHGVAFNIDLYVGNTHKTDSVIYGKLPANATEAQKIDNAYVGNVYRAVNAATTRNGKPIRLITTSFGSQPNTENYNTLEPPVGGPETFGLNASVRYLTTPEGVADSDGNTSHWFNGALEAARSGTLVQFTAGNSGYNNPTARGSVPYYFPDLEPTFFTTSGVNPGQGRTLNADGSVNVPGTQSFNRCGVAKWSCVTAPGNNINSTWWLSNPLRPTYNSASGTSMSGPHAAAVLALILQRFPYMTNTQALHTMYTTGRQNATIGATNPATQNPTRGQIVQIPDPRNGWGTVSLREAMRGPGQLLGTTNIDTKGYSDVWSLNVSDVAIQSRRAEDEAEATAWAATKEAKGWTNGVPADASDQDKFDYATGERRAAARAARVYKGSLTKAGNGTLFLTGANTYSGDTTVTGGKLSVNGSQTSPTNVAGGTLGGVGTLGALNVSGGTVAPGLTDAESAMIKDVSVPAGRVLKAGDVKFTGGTFAVFADGTGVTSLDASGDVVLDGNLAVNVTGPVGSPLTLIKGKSITGTFNGLPEGALLTIGSQTMRVSYLDNAVTLLAATTVGGTVPATLSLVLGPAAQFGAFTPGVTTTYLASSTATVTSTAGDALLSVSDPSPVGTGHLVNGTFVLPEPLQLRARNAANTGTAYNNVGSSLNLLTWSAPISNDAVTLEYSQLVKSTDPLRTGTYSKTLTYTLSTTTP